MELRVDVGSSPSGANRQRFFRFPLDGDTSIASAMTMPATGQKVHWPPNPSCTAVYHLAVTALDTADSTIAPRFSGR